MRITDIRFRKMTFTFNEPFKVSFAVIHGYDTLVLKGCVEWARENNCELITAAEMKIINDKRAKEKNKK